MGIKDLVTRVSNDSHGHRTAVGSEDKAAREQKATQQGEMRQEVM